jgi:hypothetical protein
MLRSRGPPRGCGAARQAVGARTGPSCVAVGEPFATPASHHSDTLPVHCIITRPAARPCPPPPLIAILTLRYGLNKELLAAALQSTPLVMMDAAEHLLSEGAPCLLGLLCWLLHAAPFCPAPAPLPGSLGLQQPLFSGLLAICRC